MGFGNLEQTLRRARAEDVSITRGEVRHGLNGLIVCHDRLERGPSGFVVFQLQVELQTQVHVGGYPRFQQQVDCCSHGKQGGLYGRRSLEQSGQGPGQSAQRLQR